MGLTAGFPLLDSTLRTSAAAAAAARGSFPPSLLLPPPTVRPGPVTLGFALLGPPSFATRAGTDALVAGAGAEPSVRPGPWKFSSLEDLPQRLPMGMVNGCRVECGVGEWARRGGDRPTGWARGSVCCRGGTWACRREGLHNVGAWATLIHMVLVCTPAATAGASKRRGLRLEGECLGNSSQAEEIVIQLARNDGSASNGQ